jgi:hypothetical protein
VIKLLTELIKAYVATLNWKRRCYIYELEDEIDDLAADGSPAAKLRIERISRRLRFEQKCALRSTNSDLN